MRLKLSQVIGVVSDYLHYLHYLHYLQYLHYLYYPGHAAADPDDERVGAAGVG